MANANAMRNISESEQFQQYTAFYNDNRQLNGVTGCAHVWDEKSISLTVYIYCKYLKSHSEKEIQSKTM